MLLAPCEHDLRLLLLSLTPVRKAERDKESLPRSAFGLTTTGGMVRLDEMDLHGGYGTIDPREEISTSEQNWEEWLSGIDAFGGLIVLAASLIG